MAASLKLKVDLKDLKHFQKTFRKNAEKGFPAATRAMLDHLAASTRTTAVKYVMPSMFKLRNKFIQASVQYDKVKSTTRKVNRMDSYAGARKQWGRMRKPFLGLRQQEFGLTADRSVPTLFARGGNIRSVLLRPFRFTNMRMEKPDKYPGSTEKTRTIAMLRSLDRKGSDKVFAIRKRSKLVRKSGIYAFRSASYTDKRGRRIKKIWGVRTLHKETVKLPARPWLKNSMQKTLGHNVPRKLFKEFARKKMKFRK